MKAVEMLDSKIAVKGHIHNVTWKTPDFKSGDFAIFKFDCEEIDGELPDELKGAKTIAFTGATPSLNKSMEYNIIGNLIIHERYGVQYKIAVMTENVKIENKKDARKFLEYILPPTVVENIFKTISDPIDVLEREDIPALVKAKGVGVSRAQKIIQKYKENKINSKAFIKLYDIGLTTQAVVKLSEAYGSPEALIQAIDDNPYSLIYKVKGIGWRKADEIAWRLNITKEDERRIRAYIYYLLQQDSEETGNTYAMLEELIKAVQEEMPEVELSKIKTLILAQIQEGLLYFDKQTRQIGLAKNREVEEKIAKELKRISSAPIVPINGIEDTIHKCEVEVGYTYSAEQRVAISNCLTSNISILTALAGSGKTASMLPVAQAMKDNGKYVALCALSGKASQNLEEATKVKGSTIHRLLKYNPETNGFVFNETNPLSYNMVILDEASMVDEYIFLCLLKAIPSGCKLVLVGDTGQLEPIGLGCVFQDMISSKKFAHVHLTKIFRQAQKSGVITESRRVYDGITIVKPNRYTTEIRGELEDFKIITLNESSKILYNTIAEYKRFMKEYNAKPDDIVVVVGKRAVGDTSARVFNENIQKIVNPNPTPEDITITKKDGTTKYQITFRPGDKIRVTKNCYKTLDEAGNKNPVFNGNIGHITEIMPNGMWVDFMQGHIFIPRRNFYDLELGYAITCHSAQGSGFPYVITVCDNGSYILLSKEWLYTAITRSKKFNVLIGQPSAIIHACETNGMKYKRTWLRELLL